MNIDPLIVTQASSLSSLPVDASSTDFVVSISKSSDFPGDKFFEEFSRVLKPGGEIFIQQTSADVKERTKSSLEQKLLVAGFSDIQVVQMAELQSFGIKAKKPTWKIGSSFSLKKSVKSLSKVLIDDDMDLIDEDILLSAEDLKKPSYMKRTCRKPQLIYEEVLMKRFAVEDFEVGSTIKTYWSNLIPGLKRRYFNNPWSIIALISAIVLFFLIAGIVMFVSIEVQTAYRVYRGQVLKGCMGYHFVVILVQYNSFKYSTAAWRIWSIIALAAGTFVHSLFEGLEGCMEYHSN